MKLEDFVDMLLGVLGKEGILVKKNDEWQYEYTNYEGLSRCLDEYDTAERIKYDYLLEEGSVLDSEIVEVVEQKGGGEGGAEECHSVVRVGDKFYKMEYSYYSYHGFDFDYCEVGEVKPKEKIIIVYE